MKIMLIGGTGVLSKDIAKQCILEGYDLNMINRGTKLEYAPKNTKIIIGDIYNPESLNFQLEGLNFDVVVDFLSYTPEQLSKTLELFDGKFKQYVFISSATAYSKENPDQLITEEVPMNNLSWDYSKNKIECEKLLEDKFKMTNLNYTIIRPYITYGNTRIPFALISKSKQWTLIDRILKNKPIVVWDDGSAVCTLTHTEDFAKGVVGLFGNDKAFRQAFHITTEDHISWKESIEKIGESLGKTVRIVYIPSEFIENEIPEMSGELTGDKSISRMFDNTKIKTVVKDFECSIKFSDGIKRTIEYYENNIKLRKIDKRWNAQIDILIYKYYKNNYPDKLNDFKNFALSKFNYINIIKYKKNIIIEVVCRVMNKIKWVLWGRYLKLSRLIKQK